MENTPTYLSLLFGITVIVAIISFYTTCRSKVFLIIAMVWVAIQSALALSGMYQDTQSLPPKLILWGILPTLVFISGIFFSDAGKNFINNIQLQTLTYFHTIRIPIEIVLVLLFHKGVVSVYMTYEGTNFDLISGITAPIIGFLAFRYFNKRLLLYWNILCLLLLLNVVITAIMAFPSPFQKLAFDQPNIAVLYFPFNLLPTFVVPLVLFAHLVAIKRLINISDEW